MDLGSYIDVWSAVWMTSFIERRRLVAGSKNCGCDVSRDAQQIINK
jgi:hypothetical protein